VSDRSGLTAEDSQDEILVAACMALDKAHDLLSFVVRYEGTLTPQFVEKCKAWVDGEYDPGTQRAKPCAHNWAKTVLDGSIWCTRCGIKASTEAQ
jgi:hypothetical protein